MAEGMTERSTGHVLSHAKGDDWLLMHGEPAQALAASLRQRVEQRIAAGEYLPDTIQYFNEVSFRAVPGDLTVSDKRLEQLQKLCQLWDVRLRAKEISSHRKVLGPLIVAAKRVVYPVLSAFLKESFHQQRSFNAAALSLLAELSEEVERLKASTHREPK